MKEHRDQIISSGEDQKPFKNSINNNATFMDLLNNEICEYQPYNNDTFDLAEKFYEKCNQMVNMEAVLVDKMYILNHSNSVLTAKDEEIIQLHEALVSMRNVFSGFRKKLKDHVYDTRFVDDKLSIKDNELSEKCNQLANMEAELINKMS
jgi:hypothetical protein